MNKAGRWERLSKLLAYITVYLIATLILGLGLLGDRAIDQLFDTIVR